MKMRLDKLLVERGLAATRERAQALILAGRVLVREQKLEKPGHSVAFDAPLRLLGSDLRYVSRGGLKLEAALAHWKIDVTGRFCLDVGASTGGFTDCLLQHGAARVLAVDTGYGQIAQALRDEPRVTLMERTNARLLAPGDLPLGISFLAMDVSFIAATLVLPPVIAALRHDLPSQGPHALTAGNGSVLKGHDFSRAAKGPEEKGASAPEANFSLQPSTLEAVILIKPQFEAGREFVGKGGIVRDPAGHQLAIDRVRACVEELRASGIDVIDSPITGAEGNREFLLHALWP
jgi:23S rRNA (cytidine1920-2'-O)/16S rRNA (cytidine1409-2'-O)-methyltransferase